MNGRCRLLAVMGVAMLAGCGNQPVGVDVAADTNVGPLDGEWYIVWVPLTGGPWPDDCLSIERDTLVRYGTCDGEQYGDFAGTNALVGRSPLQYDQYVDRPFSFTMTLYYEGSVGVFDLVIGSGGMVEFVDPATGILYSRGVLTKID